MDVSFLLPSLNRPPLKAVVDSIHNTSAGLDYEILVMSPENPNMDGVTWLEDKELNGQVKCYNKIARMAKGKYIVHTMDDQMFLNSVKLSLDLIESDVFKHRKYKICTMQSGNPCPLPPKNTRMGNLLNLPFDFGPHLLCRFPVLEKKTLMEHLDGYLYHPEFFSHAVDNYLGYYLAFNGETVLESGTVLRELSLTSNPKYIVVDCNTCLALMLNLQNGCNKYVYEPNPDLVKLYHENGKFLS